MANKNALKAQRQIDRALVGFKKAHASVERVEQLIQDDILATDEAIRQLQSERAESTEALNRAGTVKSKLAQFVI